MKMKECTFENVKYPETISEFVDGQKKTPMYMYAKVVEFFLKLFKIKEQKYHGFSYYEIGKGWGGLEFGTFFICCKNCSEHTKCHEIGHGLENYNVGGFSMVFHAIGSAARYWWRRISKPKTDYDDWYYEGNATAIGKELVRRMEEKENADKT